LATTFWPPAGKPEPEIRAWTFEAEALVQGPEVVRVTADPVVPGAGETSTLPRASAPARPWLSSSALASTAPTERAATATE